jgi:RNA polymerase sigma-70 factor (ECF subfamily)
MQDDGVSTETETRQHIGTMYLQHQNWIYRYLYRQLRCLDTARELTQDTYLRILSSGRLPAQVDQQRRYLTHIAKGLLIDRYRRQKTAQQYLQHQPSDHEAIVHSPEDLLQQQQQLQQLSKQLQQLSANCRQAFLLFQLEGMSCRDIAQQLGVSMSSVDKYLAQARQRCAHINK